MFVSGVYVSVLFSLRFTALFQTLCFVFAVDVKITVKIVLCGRLSEWS